MKDVEITLEDLLAVHSDAVKQMQELSPRFCHYYDDKVQRSYCFLRAINYLLKRKGIDINLTEEIKDCEDFFLKRRKP